MKKMKILIFIFLTVICKAPEYRSFTIVKVDGINPYEAIWVATGKVESNSNPKADVIDINGSRSKGIVQIQQSRVDDFNRLTGKHYTHDDMLKVEISKEVFMFFASRGNLYDMDKIIRDWNGSGPMTYDYLKKIKAKL